MNAEGEAGHKNTDLGHQICQCHRDILRNCPTQKETRQLTVPQDFGFILGLKENGLKDITEITDNV